jgi:hypothetical protein
MIIDEVREIQAGISTRLARLSTMTRRATAGPLLVRGAVYLAGLVAEFTAWPSSTVLSKGVIVLGLAALLPVLFPRSLVVSAFLLVTVAGWLASTTAYAEPLSFPRLMVLVAALYLVHTLCALAAVLPYDAVLDANVLARWILRAGLVIVLTGMVGLFAVAVPQWLGDARYLVASLVGLALVAGLAVYLGSLSRRGS